MSEAKRPCILSRIKRHYQQYMMVHLSWISLHYIPFFWAMTSDSNRPLLEKYSVTVRLLPWRVTQCVTPPSRKSWRLIWATCLASSSPKVSQPWRICHRSIWSWHGVLLLNILVCQCMFYLWLPVNNSPFFNPCLHYAPGRNQASPNCSSW